MIEFATSDATNWEGRLAHLLPEFGHRNWIVVADAAYPAQCSAGIETIVAGADHLEVLRKVIAAIAASKHIRANIYLDHELRFVPEEDAPGVSRYRQQLEQLLPDSRLSRLPHEQIIARLDQSAQVFRILIVKTELTIPYTSVFFELDCGYWNDNAEQRLRATMQAADEERNR
jgi:L-fucose mutarotase/ribose pyranase (RbsD/FucU family)